MAECNYCLKPERESMDEPYCCLSAHVYEASVDNESSECVEIVQGLEREIERLSGIERAFNCKHVWVDMRNEVVLGGEMCSACHSIRSGPGGRVIPAVGPLDTSTP